VNNLDSRLRGNDTLKKGAEGILPAKGGQALRSG